VSASPLNFTRKAAAGLPDSAPVCADFMAAGMVICVKIGVVTVYKSENCGSYLQAWAMQTVLQRMGHEVSFLPYRELSNRAGRAFQVFKCCVKGRFSTARFLIDRRRLFQIAQENLRICQDIRQIDMCLFGSDTIWNFEDPFFRDRSGFFLGAGMDCPKIAYAVSAGSTTKESFYAVDGVEAALQEFSAIGVRDANMKSVLSACKDCGSFTPVVDPTLLLDQEDYLGNSKLGLPKRYVFVYYFGRMGDDIYSQLRDFCSKNGLEIVHMGFPDQRFPINITNAPENFIHCYRHAEFVLTNTFHGCIFSIVFQKRFATDGYSKKKVDDLLRSFHLETQYLLPAQRLERCFHTAIPYDSVKEELAMRRAVSLDFLEKAIRSTQ